MAPDPSGSWAKRAGETAPIWLTVLAAVLVWPKRDAAFFLGVGVVVSVALNIVLKGTFRQPRPAFTNTSMKLAHPYFYRNGLPFQCYGMPSGHAQLSAFVGGFVALALRSTAWTSVFLASLALTCWQRVEDRFHTRAQVGVGAAVGMAVAYGVHRVWRAYARQTVRPRRDDFYLG